MIWPQSEVAVRHACELRLSDNNGHSQFTVHLLAVAQSPDNSFVLECGGCQFTGFGSQVTFRFDVPPPGRSSGTTGIGYTPTSSAGLDRLEKVVVVYMSKVEATKVEATWPPHDFPSRKARSTC